MCSYTAYIDATGKPVKISIESTCTLVAPHGEILEPRGSIVRVSYKIAGLKLPVTPCRSFMAQPLPHFSPIDVSIVIDSNPELEVYGAPERKVSVISTTKRTLLEGRSYLQLVEPKEVLEGPAVIGDNVYWFETAAPVYSGYEPVDLAKLCERLKGLGLHVWAKCLSGVNVEARLVVQALNAAEELPPCSPRIYAAALLGAGVDPARVNHVTFRINAVSGGVKVVVNGAPGLLVRLRRSDNSGYTIREIVVKKGETIIEGDWEEYSVLCRDCWLPLRR